VDEIIVENGEAKGLKVGEKVVSAKKILHAAPAY
jgi:hypothetical protein